MSVSTSSFTSFQGDDLVRGTNGSDVISTGAGDDTLVGGRGSDVMTGGVGADTFVWSAGHIGNGDTDYITDFDLRQGDMLQFLASGNGQGIEILSVTRDRLDVTDANNVDLSNNVDFGTDVIFRIQNSVTGNIQEIVLLDSWSGMQSAAWDEFLATLGTSFQISELIS